MVEKLAEIWKIENVDEFIIAMVEYVCKKCQYGDLLMALSGPERVFYVTQSLEMEVNNGGFSQFFFNSSGDLLGELVQAFTEIGANHTAELCKKALAVFGREVPADREKRQALVEDLESDILEECDNAFFEYAEDLNALNYAYIMKNKAAFV